MNNWQHTLAGLALIAVALCAVRQMIGLRRLLQRNAARIEAETAGERAARRIC